MELKDIMAKHVVTIAEDESVFKAANLMRQASVGCLVIVSADWVQGIVTDRDLTIRCLGEGHNPVLCPVSAHMTSPVITAGPNLEILDAAHLMTNKKIKRLPVVESDRLVGLASFSDVANAMVQPMSYLLAGLGKSRRLA
jgi:CBS domain-containing protein